MCATTVQIDWTTTPKWNLYRKDVLASAVSDVCAAVRWMQLQHGGVEIPVALVGFSFGGPAVWASVPRLSKVKLAGVACIAGSARGGAEHEAAKVDTDRGVKALRKRKLPCLFVHGTHDSNVDPTVTDYFFGLAGEPKRILRLRGADQLAR